MLLARNSSLLTSRQRPASVVPSLQPVSAGSAHSSAPIARAASAKSPTLAPNPLNPSASPSLSRPDVTSSAASPNSSGEASSKMEVATLGGGCFWCVEACYSMLRGVQSAISGYANGPTKDPKYKEVCSGTTGHAEVVQVTFDPSIISFKEILEIFFTLHDPTTKDRQGNDVGTQYRSIICTHNDEQKAVAEQVIAQVNADGWYSGPVVTVVEPLQIFYPGEDYHQNYFVQNPSQGYCRAVVSPKVAKIRSKYAKMLK